MKQRDDEKNSPLLLAVQAGNNKAVRLFMEKGGSAKYVDQPNDMGECPLHSATRSGDKSTVEILVKYKARLNRVNSEKESPLFLAAENARTEDDDENESIELVQFLIDNGAIVDRENSMGITPIMVAACQGHINVVKFLRDKKADLKHKDRNDQTIVHLAAKSDQNSIIEVLLEN